MPQGKKRRKPPPKRVRARKKGTRRKATPIPRTSQNYRDGSFIPQGVPPSWYKRHGMRPPKGLV